MTLEFINGLQCVWRGFIILIILAKLPQDAPNVTELPLSNFSSTLWDLFHVALPLA